MREQSPSTPERGSRSADHASLLTRRVGRCFCHVMSRPFPSALLHGVFILSGVSALIYQLVWQRALLMLYGSNSESVAMVVAAFLMGLGIGSLLGGWVTKWPGAPLGVMFGAAGPGRVA